MTTSNTTQSAAMKSKPDMQKFIQGTAGVAGVDDIADLPLDQIPAPERNIQTAVMMKERIKLAVKHEALRIRDATGRRVTESEVIEAALKAYLKIR